MDCDWYEGSDGSFAESGRSGWQIFYRTGHILQRIQPHRARAEEAASSEIGGFKLAQSEWKAAKGRLQERKQRMGTPTQLGIPHSCWGAGWRYKDIISSTCGHIKDWQLLPEQGRVCTRLLSSTPRDIQQTQWINRNSWSRKSTRNMGVSFTELVFEWTETWDCASSENQPHWMEKWTIICCSSTCFARRRTADSKERKS